MTWFASQPRARSGSTSSTRLTSRRAKTLAAARAELAAIQNSVSKGTGVLLPSDPHHREIEAAETALGEAETMMAADPIGADERILRARRSLSSLSDRPDRGLARRRSGPMSHPVIDELAAAAERLRAAAARLGVTGLLGLFIKAWIAVWVVGLLFGHPAALSRPDHHPRRLRHHSGRRRGRLPRDRFLARFGRGRRGW